MLAFARHIAFGFLLLLVGAQVACCGSVYQDLADGQALVAALPMVRGADLLHSQLDSQAPFFLQLALTEVTENEVDDELFAAPTFPDGFDPRMVEPPTDLKCRQIGTFLRHGDPRAPFALAMREHVRMTVFLI